MAALLFAAAAARGQPATYLQVKAAMLSTLIQDGIYSELPKVV